MSTNKAKPPDQTPKLKCPTYSKMIQNALINLKEANGSSKQSILRYIGANYMIKDEKTASRHLNTALNTGVKNGSLQKIRGTGDNETFKLGKTQINTQAKKQTATRRSDSVSKKALKKTVPSKIQVHPKKDVKTSSKRLTLKTIAKPTSAAETETRDIQKEPQRNIPSVASLEDCDIGEQRSIHEVIPGIDKDCHLSGTNIASETSAVSSLRSLKAGSQTRICAKIPSDERDCQICSMDITPDGRLLLVDFNNQNIKLFDQEGQYISRYVYPIRFLNMEVAALNNEEAILSVYGEKQLKVLNIKNNVLRMKDTIKLKETVKGISCYEDKIILIGLQTPTIKVIDRHGKTFWSRPRNRKDGYNEWRANCSTCFLENNKLVVIVSGTMYYKIMKLDGSSGDVLDVSDIFGTGQTGLSSDNRGLIYVCNRLSREVCVYTPSLDNYRILLSNMDAWSNLPRCVKYNATNGQLMVANNCFNTVNYMNCEYFNDCNYVESYKIIYS